MSHKKPLMSITGLHGNDNSVARVDEDRARVVPQHLGERHRLQFK